MARASKKGRGRVTGLSVSSGGRGGGGIGGGASSAFGGKSAPAPAPKSTVKTSSVVKSTPSSARTGNSVGGSKGSNTATSRSSVKSAPAPSKSVSKTSASKGTSVNLSKAGSFDPKAGQITTGFKKGTSVNLSKAGSLNFSAPSDGGILSPRFQVFTTPASKTVPLKDAPVFKQTLQGLLPLNQKALDKALIEGRPFVLPASLVLKEPVNQSYVVDSPVRERYFEQPRDPITEFFSPQEAFADSPANSIGGLTLINTPNDPVVQQPSGSNQQAPEGGFVGGVTDSGAFSELGEKASNFFDSLKKDPVKLAMIVIGAIALILVFGGKGRR